MGGVQPAPTARRPRREPPWGMGVWVDTRRSVHQSRKFASSLVQQRKCSGCCKS